MIEHIPQCIPDAAPQIAFRIRVLVVALDGDDVTDRIRTPEASSDASRVSALAPVRAALPRNVGQSPPARVVAASKRVS